MKAVFVHDTRYMKKNGHIYTELEFSYESWRPYLRYFDSLRVIGRDYEPDNDVFENAERYNQCDGPDVTFSLYPRLTTFRNFIFEKRRIAKSIEEDIRQADAVILRGVQENVVLAYRAAKKLKKPVILEGTGCMWNNTWHYGSPLGKIYAPLRYLNAKRVFQGADAVLYVTESFLQNRYPTHGIQDHASDVKLDPPDESVLDKRLERISRYKDNHVFKIGIIGPVHHNHKGIDNAIKALADSGIHFDLHILGRGDPANMQHLADSLNVGKHIHFDGLLPQNQVKNWLDSLDIYLQPSRTEGLPRATLEAMSRAIPTITSDAGDLPSIIEAGFVHKRHDINDLKYLLQTMTSNKKIMAQQATRNFQTIKTDFHPETLKSRREAFWNKFIEITKARKASQTGS